MIDIIAAATIAKLVSDAVGSLDKVFRGYADFAKGQKPKVMQALQPDFSYQDSPENHALVAKSRSTGQVYQTVTYAELASRLGRDDLSYVQDLSDTMRIYEKQWSTVYKQKALAPLGLPSAQIDFQLDHLATEISRTLTNILTFVERTGIHLDDHYHVARQIAAQYLSD